MRAASDQAGDVRHFEDVMCADFVSDLAHTGEVPHARVGGTAANDGLGLFAQGDGFELVVIDKLRVLADGVKRGAVELAREAELVAMRQVTAMGEIEAE